MNVAAAAKETRQQAFSPSEASHVAGVSEWMIRREISQGRLAARKFGTRVIILKEDLDLYLRNLPRAKGHVGPRP